MTLRYPFAAYDVEALDWNRYKFAAVVTSEGDVERCHTPEQLAKVIGQMRRRVYSHFGGRYDMFFLPPLQSIVLSGSGILRAIHGQATLLDSWNLFQMKLAKLGKAVGIEKFEGKSDAIDTLTQTEIEEHCINDTRILVEALRRHQEWCSEFGERWPATAGATAMHAFESLEADGVAHLKAQTLDVREWFDHASAVSGGRVEVFHIGRAPTDVYAYDINSSYPRSWLEAPLPLGPWESITKETTDPAVYFCDRIEQSRETLPVVAPGFQWRYDGEGWVTSEELRALRDAGGAARVVRGYASRVQGWLGRRFVEQLYARKQAGDPWAKVSVNSAHGKTSQGLLHETYYRRKDGSYVRDLELTLPSWHQRPLIGAFLLARARIRLWETMRTLSAMGERVYYCDTDCIHTSCPPERFPGTVGDVCGEWKLENGPCEAVYVAPKVYGLRSADGKTKLVCKGFPSKVVTWGKLLAATRGESVSATDRSGLVSFRSQRAWGATVSELSRTLRVQRGGKNGSAGNVRGPLRYADGGVWAAGSPGGRRDNADGRSGSSARVGERPVHGFRRSSSRRH